MHVKRDVSILGQIHHDPGPFTRRRWECEYVGARSHNLVSQRIWRLGPASVLECPPLVAPLLAEDCWGYATVICPSLRHIFLL